MTRSFYPVTGTKLNGQLLRGVQWINDDFNGKSGSRVEIGLGKGKTITHTGEIKMDQSNRIMSIGPVDVLFGRKEA